MAEKRKIPPPRQTPQAGPPPQPLLRRTGQQDPHGERAGGGFPEKGRPEDFAGLPGAGPGHGADSRHAGPGSPLR